MKRCFLSLLLALCAAARLPAWSGPGHRIIARIAELRLTPKAAAEVHALLGAESMAEASVWADGARATQPASAQWHYMNIPIGAADPDPAKFCPAGGCVMSKIGDMAAALRDSTKQERSEKLKYLIHFVSDLHQPLHVGDRGDRGGNDLQLAFFGNPTNLHAVWDRWLVSLLGQEDADVARELAAKAQDRWVRGTAREWALESYAISREVAYKDLSKDLRQDYADRCLPSVKIQLAKAGVRLAALLNGIWE